MRLDPAEGAPRTWPVADALVLSVPFDRDDLARDDFVVPGGMMHTRALYDRIGPFDETLFVSDDWDWLLRAAAVTDFVRVPEVVITVRMHGDNLSALLQRQGDLEEAENLCREALALELELLGPDHPDVAVTRRNLAQLLVARGELPEAEQELGAGYHTEYSGMRFAMYFMAEYVAMLTVSSVAATVFFGGPLGPFGLANGPWWFVLKVACFMFVFIWLRATFPRFRYDQLMRIGWQILLPLGLLNFMLTAVGVALHGANWTILASVVVTVAVLAVMGKLRRATRRET